MKTINEKIIKSYKKYLVEEEKSKNTVLKYMRDVIAFTKWVKDKTLSKSAVLEYKEHLRTYFTNTSINSVLSSLNSFFGFCGCPELKVKMIKIQNRIFASDDKDLTTAEYERLLDAAKQTGNEKLYLMTQTIASTGIIQMKLK